MRNCYRKKKSADNSSGFNLLLSSIRYITNYIVKVMEKPVIDRLQTVDKNGTLREA